MKRYDKQVIVKEAGNSWLGVYITHKKMQAALDHILALSISDTYKAGEWANAFWLLDLDGACVAAQSTLHGCEKYYRDGLILVHYQKTFV